jgi:hypothetical protein
MLKHTLAIILILVSVGFCDEITFTAAPEPIDESVADDGYGNLLPNTSCRAITEFKGGPNQGKLMFIDMTNLRSQEYGENGTWVWADVGYAILDLESLSDPWTDFASVSDEIPGEGIAGLLVRDGNVDPDEIYSQLPNASIFSDANGDIHMGYWRGQVFPVYSRYQVDNSIPDNNYRWFFDGTTNPHMTPMYPHGYGTEGYHDQQRFGQVLQPAFYLNEVGVSFPPVTKPTFFVNGHDSEDVYTRAGFYVQELTDLSNTGIWDDPVVVSPQYASNVGFGSVTGDETGRLHLFWSSSINSGSGGGSWHAGKSMSSRSELYYATYSNGQVSNVKQITDVVDVGFNVTQTTNISSCDIDPDGNVWALFEVLRFDLTNLHTEWIGVVKISPGGTIMEGPTHLFETPPQPGTYSYCVSPQLQIDTEGVAHFVVTNCAYNGAWRRYLYYGSFDTSIPFTQLGVNDLTLVSEDNPLMMPSINYDPGVGHMFVDSQRRIHFMWNSLGPNGEGEYSKIYYRRSESFATSMRDTKDSAPMSLAAIEIKNVFHGIYPNPARNNVNITFTLGEAQEIRVGVYDIAGRLVSVPYEGPIAAGRHALEWNLDDGQNSVSDGLYLIKFESDSLNTVERVVVTR